MTQDMIGDNVHTVCLHVLFFCRRMTHRWTTLLGRSKLLLSMDCQCNVLHHSFSRNYMSTKCVTEMCFFCKSQKQCCRVKIILILMYLSVYIFFMCSYMYQDFRFCFTICLCGSKNHYPWLQHSEVRWMFSVASVCLCLSVCQHNHFQTIKHRMMKLGSQVHCRKISPEFKFWGHSLHIQNVAFCLVIMQK